MCQLLEKAREELGNVSYYEIAKRLNVSMQVMNKWKNNKSQPNGENTLKLAKMANLSINDALNLVTEPTPCAACGRVHDKRISCILCKIERNLKMWSSKHVFKHFDKTLTANACQV